MNEEEAGRSSPKRWTGRDAARGGPPVDDRIAALLAQVPEVEALPSERLQRVGDRLRRSVRRPRRLRLRWGMAGLLLCSSAGAVFARHDLGRFISALTDGHEVRPADRAPATRTRSRRERRPVSASGDRLPLAEEGVGTASAVASAPGFEGGPSERAPAEAPPVAVAAEAPAGERVSGRGARPARRVALSPRPMSVSGIDAPAAFGAPPAEAPSDTPPPGLVASAPAAPPARAAAAVRSTPPLQVPPLATELVAATAPLGAEAAVLRRAVKSLRLDGDPAAALVHLDEHARRHPAGLLRTEAALLRVDALLALGNRADTLALLESLHVERLPGAEERLVQRGELRVAGDPLRAIGDLDRALAQRLPVPLELRALEARARAHLATGDSAAAAADAARYLRRAPAGRFATEARRLVDATSSPDRSPVR